MELDHEVEKTKERKQLMTEHLRSAKQELKYAEVRMLEHYCILDRSRSFCQFDFL